MNCNRWLDDYRILYESLREFDTNELIVIGDLNGRTGTEQVFLSYKNVIRKSKDTTVNNKGRKIIDLCNSCGLTVVNGCASNDLEGNFTFIGGQGCSVIDYCLVGLEIQNRVKRFEIDLQDYSDHLPVVVNVGCR